MTLRNLLNNITDALAYIAEQLLNRDAAIHLLDEVTESVYKLEEMPLRYPLVDDEYLANLGIRCFPVRNYLVFYAVREERNTVVIKRFLYGKRDWTNILKLNNMSL